MTLANPPPPPWVKYSGSDPLWAGWRQGTSEDWLVSTWLPYWHQLSPVQRTTYLQQWAIPSEDWMKQIEAWNAGSRD